MKCQSMHYSMQWTFSGIFCQSQNWWLHFWCDLSEVRNAYVIDYFAMYIGYLFIINYLDNQNYASDAEYIYAVSIKETDHGTDK